MNTRQKEILHILLSMSDGYILVQNLADRLGCSEKTIRNDFKVIEGYLEEYSNAFLIRRPGSGVFLDIEEHEKKDLFNRLCIIDERTQYESDEERILQIAYHLLMNVKPVTALEIASQHFVNRTMIKRDLDTIEHWLHQLDLVLVSKQRVGLAIEGSETNKRRALARLSDLIDNQEYTNQFIKKQFLYHEVEFVMNELKALQKHHAIYFTDDTFESLLVHTLFMVRRMKLKQSITISKREVIHLQEMKEYKWTLEFLKRLEFVFSVHFSEEEVAYLTVHILGGKFRYQQRNGLKEGNELTEKNPILSSVLKYLIENVSKLNGMDFSRDKALVEGLRIHLYSTLNRLNYNLPVANPMLNDIKKMYPYMFDMMIHVLEEINQLFSLRIPEEEAAYITLHFQASIERLNTKREVLKKIIIVCHMGIGMSQLLRTKIERRFHDIHVMGCIAKADLEEYIANHHDVELVISTIPLPDLKIPHLVVSPLLEVTEERKLERFIKQIDEPIHRERQDFAILTYTTPFLVFLQQEVEHRYELIEKLAKALHDKGYVEKEYASNAIARERMAATTIGTGIAIPHGNPKYIRHSAIAIATLREPIDWDSEKVTLVFMLAVKNDEQEVTKQLFRELSFMSEQPAFIHTLTTEKDTMKFLSHLKY